MRQHSLFDSTNEKGRAEWRTFSAVRDDRPGALRVAKPEPAAPRYGSAVASRKFSNPHELFPKPAH